MGVDNPIGIAGCHTSDDITDGNALGIFCLGFT